MVEIKATRQSDDWSALDDLYEKRYQNKLRERMNAIPATVVGTTATLLKEGPKLYGAYLTDEENDADKEEKAVADARNYMGKQAVYNDGLTGAPSALTEEEAKKIWQGKFPDRDFDYNEDYYVPFQERYGNQMNWDRAQKALEKMGGFNG